MHHSTPYVIVNLSSSKEKEVSLDYVNDVFEALEVEMGAPIAAAIVYHTTKQSTKLIISDNIFDRKEEQALTSMVKQFYGRISLQDLANVLHQNGLCDTLVSINCDLPHGNRVTMWHGEVFKYKN